MILKQLYRFFNPKFQNLFSDYYTNFQPRYGHGMPPHAQLYEIINANRSLYADMLTKALEHKSLFWQIKKQKDTEDTSLPGWNNGFLPGLDIIGIISLMAHFRPKKYVEVGSGNSTKVAHLTKTKFELDTKITSIDPFPRAEIDQLADEIIREGFEDIDLTFLFSLEENDVLFIDNSHRIFPNSDAMVFFMEVLSKLKRGVIVHIHDIYLPYDYPQFMCDRFYSEQYGLAFYLLANPEKFQSIFPNYFISEDEELMSIIDPIWKHPNLENVERHGGSFWLKIN